VVGKGWRQPAIEEETVKEEEGACVRQTRKARSLFLIQQVIFPTFLIPGFDFHFCHMSHIQTRVEHWSVLVGFG